jgi:hypothetical protein
MEYDVPPDAYARVLDLAEQIRPILQTYGKPQEVLSACLLIVANEACGRGASLDEFIDAVRAWCSIAWPKSD